MPLNIAESLLPMASIFLAAQGESDQQLTQRLVTLGMEEVEARQWTLLMPIAFARVAYHFQLPELYSEENQYVQCEGEDGGSNVIKLDQLAPYMVAKDWASNCGLMDQISSPEYNAIVRRSVEFQAIQDLRSGVIQTMPPLALKL